MMYEMFRLGYEDAALRQEALREARAQRLILAALAQRRRPGIRPALLLALASLVALLLGSRS